MSEEIVFDVSERSGAAPDFPVLRSPLPKTFLEAGAAITGELRTWTRPGSNGAGPVVDQPSTHLTRT
ncbi:hypothetical protein [Methylobacterium iners]|uniref:Uncharacterized protein n=1 Tax=Methylobacterium iners TaxID=418707 RepID=A0ABQ4RZ47_9HYPH|nr:hypothetical protein [Methylobacterium iners]GJD96125.1 hypothetical protein OCOJLMKI_3343 [Methylobacterium iners]